MGSSAPIRLTWAAVERWQALGIGRFTEALSHHENQ